MDSLMRMFDTEMMIRNWCDKADFEVCCPCCAVCGAGSAAQLMQLEILTVLSGSSSVDTTLAFLGVANGFGLVLHQRIKGASSP